MVDEKDMLNTLEILSRIEEKLAEKGISKADFFKGAGVSQGAYSQWKTGRTKPTTRSIRAIAEYLGTTDEYLLYGAEKPAFSGGLTDAQRELIRLLPHLSAQELAVLVAAAKAQVAARQGQGCQG